MATYTPPKRATAYTTYISLVSQDDTDLFQTSVTLAAGDVQISKDGGAFANIATLPTEIGTSGVLSVVLSSTEMTADTVVVRFRDAAGDEWCDALIVIHTSEAEIDDIAGNVLAETVEGSLTLTQVLRLMLSALAGKSSGGGTTSIAFRDVADGKDRIAATVDGGGNRTAISLDGS